MTQSARFDRLATIERPARASDPEWLGPDPDTGRERIAWTPIAGYQPGSPPIPVRIPGNRQDMLPSRSESAQQGMLVGRRQVRWRMRWRDDIDSSMRVTIHGNGDEVYQIVGGPAEFDGRRRQIELLLERSTAQE